MDGASRTTMHSSRFMDWILLFIFSLIVVGAGSDQRGSASNGELEDVMLGISILSLILSIGAILFYLSRKWSVMFINKGVEGTVIIYLVVTWCVAVVIATDSQWEIAVDEEGRVKNGNLYYFSWVSFFLSVGLLSNYVAAVYSLRVLEEVRRQGKRMTTWANIFVVSVVVMSNSAHILGTACMGENPDEKDYFCSSASYGIAFGVICVTISLVVISQKIKHKLQFFVKEAILGAITCALYALGVAILTSNSGAAAQLGNLYYATWVGFLISCMIVKSCWLDFQIAKYMNDQSLSDSKTQVEMSENNNLSVGPQIIIDDRHANVAGDDDI